MSIRGTLSLWLGFGVALAGLLLFGAAQADVGLARPGHRTWSHPDKAAVLVEVENSGWLSADLEAIEDQPGMVLVGSWLLPMDWDDDPFAAKAVNEGQSLPTRLGAGETGQLLVVWAIECEQLPITFADDFSSYSFESGPLSLDTSDWRRDQQVDLAIVPLTAVAHTIAQAGGC